MPFSLILNAALFPHFLNVWPIVPLAWLMNFAPMGRRLKDVAERSCDCEAEMELIGFILIDLNDFDFEDFGLILF
jgi:hypothetical protein